jgi:uncharacterized protein YndB with AHSA1/START domain
VARRVVVQVDVEAPIERVWRALCDPREVQSWDGAKPLDVPDGYPEPGQHARWRTRLGPFPVVLHDEVRAVEAPKRLAARITYGFVALDEEYRLETSDGTTRVTSENVVHSRPPGFGWLAAALTQSAVQGAMERLAQHCASR